MIFTFVSCYYMRDDHVKAAVFYIIGSGLDAADGYAARYFKQGATGFSIHEYSTVFRLSKLV